MKRNCYMFSNYELGSFSGVIPLINIIYGSWHNNPSLLTIFMQYIVNNNKSERVIITTNRG